MILHYMGKVDSTNRWAKKYRNLRQFHVFYAGYQTAGKGRMARKWISSPNTNVLMTIAHPISKICNPPWFSGLVASYTIINILKTYGINAYYKWPNDIWTNRGKIAGILPETILEDKISALIVGIGLNVNEKSFPQSIQASSMFIETGKTYDIHYLIRKLANFYIASTSHTPSQIVNYLWQHFVWKEKEIIALPDRITGIASNMTEKGELIIRTKEGKKLVLKWGEITIRKGL